MFVVTALFWLIFTIVICCMAKSRGRSALGFFLLSFFLSPLVGLIVLLIVGKNEPHVVEVRYADAPKSDSAAEASATEEKTE